MAELKQIDPRENIGIIGTPTIADLSSLARLQKYPGAEAGEPDYSDLWRDYFTQAYGDASNEVGGGILFFQDTKIRDERAREAMAQGQTELLSSDLPSDKSRAAGLRIDEFKEWNFATLRDEDLMAWAEVNVFPRIPEEHYATAIAQAEGVYVNDFADKFESAKNKVQKQNVRNQNDIMIDQSVQFGSVGLRTSQAELAEAVDGLARLEQDIAAKEAAGLPVDAVFVDEQREQYDATIARITDPETGDLTKALGSYDKAMGMAHAGGAALFYNESELTARSERIQRSRETDLIEGYLDGTYGVMVDNERRRLEDEFMRDNPGATEFQLDQAGARAATAVNYERLDSFGKDFVGQMPPALFGMSSGEKESIVNARMASWRSDDSSARHTYNILSEERTREYLTAAHRIQLPAALGREYTKEKIEAAEGLMAQLETASATKYMKSADVEQVRNILQGYLKGAYGTEEEMPDDVRIAFSRELDKLEREAHINPVDREGLTANMAAVKVTTIVDGETKVWSVPYEMYNQRVAGYDISSQYDALYARMGQLVSRAGTTEQANLYIEKGNYWARQLGEGALTQDQALLNYELEILAIEKDTPSNREQRTGRSHFGITTKQYVPTISGTNDFQTVLQTGRQYDHDNMGSMMGEEGFLTFANRALYEEATRANYGDEGAELQLDAMAPNIDSRFTGFDERTGKFLTAINKGIYEEAIVDGVMVRGFLANIYEQGYMADVFDELKHDQDTPELRLLNEVREESNVEYFMYQDPRTGDWKTKVSNTRYTADGKLQSLTLNESFDSRWGMNDELRSQMSGFGGSLLARGATWDNEQDMIGYYTRRTSQKVEPPVGIPESIIAQEEQFQEVPTPYQVVEMFLGGEREISGLDVVLDPTTRAATLSTEAVRYRALGRTKSLVDEEEMASGEFWLPTLRHIAQTERIGRRGQVIKVEESFEPTEQTRKFGDFIRVPKEYSEYVSELYFSGKQDEALEFMESVQRGDFIFGSPGNF